VAPLIFAVGFLVTPEVASWQAVRMYIEPMYATLCVMGSDFVIEPSSRCAPVRTGPRSTLADIAADVYDGDVISDACGSGRSGVRLTVVKTGPNTIYVTATYPRLAPFRRNCRAR
jgi:hypothetical protein